jgi:hypothetical protein
MGAAAQVLLKVGVALVLVAGVALIALRAARAGEAG